MGFKNARYKEIISRFYLHRCPGMEMSNTVVHFEIGKYSDSGDLKSTKHSCVFTGGQNKLCDSSNITQAITCLCGREAKMPIIMNDSPPNNWNVTKPDVTRIEGWYFQFCYFL